MEALWQSLPTFSIHHCPSLHNMDLSGLSRQDLQRLLGSSLHPSASDAAFQEWFETLPQVAATRQHERELRDKAESLAGE